MLSSSIELYPQDTNDEIEFTQITQEELDQGNLLYDLGKYEEAI